MVIPLSHNNNQLTLVSDSGAGSVELSIVTATVLTRNDTAKKQSEKQSTIKLQCSVHFSEYEKILQCGWLNLTVRNQENSKKSKFYPGRLLQLYIILKTDLFPQQLDSEAPQEALITHLQQLTSSFENIHPLRQEQNWFCTTVSQAQPDDTTLTHYTLWHYLLPALTDPDPDTLAHSISQYIQTETADSLSQITQAADPLFQDLAQTFQDLFTGTLADLTSALEPDNNSSERSLLKTLTNFLESEDWAYTLSPVNTSETTTFLRLAFQGKNGQWPCYATINESTHTCCFYSISPVDTSPDSYGTIAEFITRANSGMIIGNFELDYADGTLSYKTSLDVQEAQLTHALLRNLIYTNVLTMDQYLPGIQALLQQNVSPTAAIQAIESLPTHA